MHTTSRLAATGTVLFVAALRSSVAFAAPAGARAAYDAGTKAHEAGHFSEAARAFAEADRLAPNDVALGAALDDALLANDAPLLAELAERAEPRRALAKSVAKARTQMKGRVGGIRVVCGRSGAVTVDRVAIHFPSTVWLAPGLHTVAWTFPDTVSTLQSVELPADAVVTASCAVALAPLPGAGEKAPAASEKIAPPTAEPAPPRAPAPSEPPAPAPRGLSPAYFVGAAAATVGVGILGVFAQGSVTRAGRSLDACTSVIGDDPQFCGEERSRVDSASTLRTAAWVGAGAMALGTIALAAFGTRWRSSVQVTATVAPNEVGLGFRRPF